MITQEELRNLTIYDPETGHFTWRIARRKVSVGRVAGTLNARGYWQINILGSLYYAHRLAFLYMTGKWPVHLVDHINMNKIDNRWCNLREATASENQVHSKGNSYSYSGFKGVYLGRGGRWYARISLLGGGHVNVGRFSSAEEAAKERDKQLSKYHGQFAYHTFGEQNEIKL